MWSGRDVAERRQSLRGLVNEAIEHGKYGERHNERVNVHAPVSRTRAPSVRSLVVSVSHLRPIVETPRSLHHAGMSNRLPLLLSALAVVLAPVGGFLGAYAAGSSTEQVIQVEPTPTKAARPASDLRGGLLLVPGIAKCPEGTERVVVPVIGTLASVLGSETVIVPGLRDGTYEEEEIATVVEAPVRVCEIK